MEHGIDKVPNGSNQANTARRINRQTNEIQAADSTRSERRKRGSKKSTRGLDREHKNSRSKIRDEANPNREKRGRPRMRIRLVFPPSRRRLLELPGHPGRLLLRVPCEEAGVPSACGLGVAGSGVASTGTLPSQHHANQAGRGNAWRTRWAAPSARTGTGAPRGRPRRRRRQSTGRERMWKKQAGERDRRWGQAAAGVLARFESTRGMARRDAEEETTCFLLERGDDLFFPGWGLGVGLFRSVGCSVNIFVWLTILENAS
jgi:hypothetical protein